MEYNGSNYFTSNTYFDTIYGGAFNGCDSIIILDLTVNQPSRITLTDTICFGETFKPYATEPFEYVSTGIFIDTFSARAANGCDSILTTNLVVLERADTVIDVTICNDTSFTYQGITYLTTNTYPVTLANQAVGGCDSFVTINLTVNPVTYESLTLDLCEGEQFEVGGLFYDSTGI